MFPFFFCSCAIQMVLHQSFTDGGRGEGGERVRRVCVLLTWTDRAAVTHEIREISMRSMDQFPGNPFIYWNHVSNPFPSGSCYLFTSCFVLHLNNAPRVASGGLLLSCSLGYISFADEIETLPEHNSGGFIGFIYLVEPRSKRLPKWNPQWTLGKNKNTN